MARLHIASDVRAGRGPIPPLTSPCFAKNFRLWQAGFHPAPDRKGATLPLLENPPNRPYWIRPKAFRLWTPDKGRSCRLDPDGAGPPRDPPTVRRLEPDQSLAPDTPHLRQRLPIDRQPKLDAVHERQLFGQRRAGSPAAAVAVSITNAPGLLTSQTSGCSRNVSSELS